jgi:hypothetical protein
MWLRYYFEALKTDRSFKKYLQRNHVDIHTLGAVLKRIIFVLSLIVALLGVRSEIAAGEPIRHFLLSCNTTPEIECIESITAINQDGFRATATNPAKSFIVHGDLNPTDTLEEWALPGFSFEGSARDRVVPRVIFRPLGSEQCAHGQCIEGIEELQIGIEASWLNRTPQEEKEFQIDLSRRGSQNLCGSVSAPRVCVRSHLFNSEVTFEISLRIPSDFVPAALLGSVKNLSFKTEANYSSINSTTFNRLSFIFTTQEMQNVLFSDQVPKPMETSDYADFITDRVNFWILGSRSSQSSALGKCSTVPFITVLSNSVFQSLPQWNSATDSIDVWLTAPHLQVDGELHKGYFEARVSKAMGKCLWNVDLSTKSIAKMSIAYSGESGQEVQTVSGKFDGENYILFAANFHYSMPKVSLKMENPSVESSSIPNPTKVTSKSAIKTRSILCVKGKQKKIVKGLNPKCPNGFKKAT